jgi:1-acyl-sn-glycerol-3-phosphate acyltransferase
MEAGEPGVAWLYQLSRRVCLAFCRLYFRLRVEDVANVPRHGPVILASNHASHLDPVLLGVFLQRHVHYVARSSLGRVPLLGAWMRRIGTIFIDRKAPGREALGRAIEVLEVGGILGYFPEGTRSRDGAVAPFQRGLLLLLKKCDATVVPVGIRGSFAAFPPGKNIPRPFSCSVHYGRPRSAAEVLAPGGIEALHAAVAHLVGDPDPAVTRPR